MYTEGAKLGSPLAHSLLPPAIVCALVVSGWRALPNNLLLVRLSGISQDHGRLTAVDRAESIRAGTPTASWVAGRIEWQAGDVAGATELWKTAPASNAERLRLLGVETWRHGRYDDAIDLARVGLELDPSSNTLANVLGAWRLSRGQVVLLQRDVQSALARAPRNATALAYRGRAAQLSGAPAAALADFERSLSLEPDNPVALRYLAELLTNTGGPRDRIEQLLLRGNRRWPHDDVFSYGLAQFYVADHRYGDAAPHVRRLQVDRPNDAYAREVVGGYYLMCGQYAVALEQYRIAARMVPTESRFLIGIGDALAGSGRRTEAEAAYVKAAKMGDWRAPEHLARLKVTEEAQ